MTTTAHTPKNFDPANYRLLGYYYLGHSEEMGDMVAETHPIVEADDSAALFDAIEGKGSAKCQHCGALHKYGAGFEYKPTGETVLVGWICGSKWELLDSRADYVRSQLERKAKAAREKARNVAALASMLADDAELAAAFEVDHYIIADIKGRALNWAAKNLQQGRAPVSEKQRALCLKLAREAAEKAARKAAEALEAPAGPVPTGRIDIEGVVLSTKVKTNQWGSAIKMLVKLDNGSKVWGTLPSALENGPDWFEKDNGVTVVREFERTERQGVSVGCRVKFTATVEASRDDASFGFYKRPSKAAFVTE